MAICTNCSLLCQDIEVALKAGEIEHARNVCRKGAGHFQAMMSDRTVPRVGGEDVTIDRAIERAAEILKSAKDPLLYGWSNSTLEAQREGIALAKKLGATIDDTSSFCQGILMEKVLKGEMPTCTLDDVRNFADVIIFWGSDPANSHPRHLSKFSYYPRGEKRQKGYEEERTAIVIDVRKSDTAEISDLYFRVPPGGDEDFIAAVNAVIDGKIPKIGDKKKMIELGTVLRKAQFGVVFPGLGLVYSLREKMDLFADLVRKLDAKKPFKVVPMVGHYNMRGFNQLMLDQTGFINSVSFKGGEVRHGIDQSVMSASKTCDCAMVVGSDPLSSLPFGAARALAKKPLIAIDPRRSLTTDAAEVVIPTAMYGLEAGGTAIRMDGVQVQFEPILPSTLPSDEEILRRIKEMV